MIQRGRRFNNQNIHNKINNVTDHHIPLLNPIPNNTFTSNTPYFNNTKKLSAADTGASHNYNTITHIPKGSTILEHQPMQVILPNSQVITSKQTILLPEPKELPPEARIANTFNQLTEGFLTSIGQYCDNGCTAIFNKIHEDIIYKDQLILRGHRNPSNKL